MCPAPFLPPGCQDITRAATADATLAGLLATAASVFIVLILQAEKLNTQPKARNAILSLLVSTFFSTLLASFTFGLLTGEEPTIRVDVLLNFAASPILIVGALQFLSNIGWLLSLYQAERTSFTIARWAFVLGRGLTIVYLALDCFDFLNETTQGVWPGAVYDVLALLVAFLIILIAWLVPKRLKGRNKEADCILYAKSGLCIAAGCTLLYGIMSDFSPTDLQNAPDPVYSLGVGLLMVALVWFACLSELSWPLQPPESPERSAQPSQDQPEPSTDDTVTQEAAPVLVKEPAAPTSEKASHEKGSRSSA